MATEKMWFGTQDFSTWIEPPLSGADSSPQSWSTSGTDLNGHGYAFNSWGSHKVYQYSWADSSAREAASLMKSFADGTYGRGKLFFIEPNIYETNVLPARWADPSITTDFEGPSLIPGVEPTSVPAGDPGPLMLPVRAASYNLNSTPPFADVNDLDDTNSVFIPIPDGMQLNLGFYGSSTGDCGVFATEVATGGAATMNSQILLPITDGSLFNRTVSKRPGIIGVRIFMTKYQAGNATLVARALHARLSKAGEVPTGPANWVGGAGHAGARMEGKPTFVTYNRVNGGQAGYAVTLREVMY